MAAVPPSARTNGVQRTNGAARTNGAPRANGGPAPKPRANPSRPPVPRAPKAASVSGESPVNGVTSAYAIMANRIANRVAEMAESITFVERYTLPGPDFTTEPSMLTHLPDPRHNNRSKRTRLPRRSGRASSK